MKLLRSVAAATVAAISMTIPALAKVDAGSIHLLETLREYGVTVEYNPSYCSQGFAGRYSTAKVMTLCYQNMPTAEDHDTIRHETAHVLQHCANMRRGGRGIQPLAINPDQRNQWVKQVLKNSTISHVIETYPERAHQIELEAFAMAHHYDATQLANLVKAWCVK